jgi:site-specific recombinase XerD
MSSPFIGPLAKELADFLVFKRALGFPYGRAEFTLREFDRFVHRYTRGRPQWRLRGALLSWLASKKGRKPVTVTVELGVIRQFCRYRQRHDPGGFVPGREWAPQSTQSEFLPHIFSRAEMRRLLSLAAVSGKRGEPMARGSLRLLLVILYCTGLRLGEATRLRFRDVDVARGILFISKSKGRSRWVPFHQSMRPEFARYLRGRRLTIPADPEAPLFLRRGRMLSVRHASDLIRGLLRHAVTHQPHRDAGEHEPWQRKARAGAWGFMAQWRS